MRGLATCFAGLLFAVALISAEPERLVREAIANDSSLFTSTRDYTYISRRIVTQIGKDGERKTTDDETHEDTVLYGRPYSKLIERHGTPISEKDVRKEERKVETEAARRKKRAAKQAIEEERERNESAEAAEEVMRAFDFRIAGVEPFGGRDAWVIEATPRKGFQPRSRQGKIFPKLSGRLWIDRVDTRLVKVSALVNEQISFGWFLLQLLPGAVFEHERTRLNEGVWLPARDVAKGEAKIGGLKKVKAEVITSYSGYRRFGSTSTFTATAPN